ncbi:DUF4893 domain-containing protein [uncultured Sphingomonas sp.]|uniref:DUF4893 domain-containing protein n=1 Tax=uncultured Sphingomonas sp. TaxID=158754 RepID=UPI0035CAB34E
MRRAAFALVLSSPVIGACATRPLAVVEVEPIVEAVELKEWEKTVTPTDRAGLAALPDRWRRARAAVPRRGARTLAAEGPLVDPAVALDLPTPPPGPYHCRLVRFGGRAGIATFPPDFCYVETSGGGLSFTKQTGGNLPQGWLHQDGPTREVFLGTTGPGRYSDDPARDVAGVVERVSPFRWRLALTRAGRGALLDVYELVPVTPEVPGAKSAVPATE